MEILLKIILLIKYRRDYIKNIQKNVDGICQIYLNRIILFNIRHYIYLIMIMDFLLRVASTPGMFSPKFRGYEFPRAPRRTAFRSLCLSFPADGMPGFFLRDRCFAVDADL